MIITISTERINRAACTHARAAAVRRAREGVAATPHRTRGEGTPHARLLMAPAGSPPTHFPWPNSGGAHARHRWARRARRPNQPGVRCGPRQQRRGDRRNLAAFAVSLAPNPACLPLHAPWGPPPSSVSAACIIANCWLLVLVSSSSSSATYTTSLFGAELLAIYTAAIGVLLQHIIHCYIEPPRHTYLLLDPCSSRRHKASAFGRIRQTQF